MTYARGKNPNSRNGFKLGHKSAFLGKKQKSESIKKRTLSRAGFKHSEETKKKIGLKHKGKMGLRGEKCPLWRGGVTEINALIRSSAEYKLWRSAVFQRDNHTCVWCRRRGGDGKALILNADHIKPFALFPELRFAIDNGRTLCVECHRTTDTWGSKTKKPI